MQHFHVIKRSRAGNTALPRAFTLVELLVGMAVLSIMVMMLVGVLGQVGNAWSRTEGQSGRLRSGRSIADFIRNDLKGALLPIAPELDDKKPNLHFVLNTAPVPQELRQPAALFWQASIANDLTLGDVAEVGYFVRWDSETNPQNPRANLCRFFVGPTDTPNYQIYNTRDWLTAAIIDAVAPAHNKRDPETNEPMGYRGLLADNVIGFWARCSKTGHTNETLLAEWDSRKTETRGLPVAVEVTFAMLDEEGAKRIGQSEQEDIMSAVQTANDAYEFVEEMQKRAVPPPYLNGLRAFGTLVYLENAR